MHKSDVVVVGSGVAGLTFAIRLAEEKPDCQIYILSKGAMGLTNTSFAQGGIAAVVDQKKDSFKKHIEDTLKSGDGFSSPSIVRSVIEKAPKCIETLINYGVKFTRKENGGFDLALEGGHSLPRVVHVFDKTGYYVQSSLLKTAQSFSNITFYEHRFAIELLKGQDCKVIGLSALHLKKNKIAFFSAKLVVLATGGSGQVYQHTTNPSVATGDGVAIGLKAGGMISHLGFVQFHPTALYEKGKPRLELITEAIRGFGAYIVNKKGERFLTKDDKRGELATRDIVSKSIFQELKRSNETNVYLDCRHLNYEVLKQNFPYVISNLEEKGISVKRDLIPIVPASHYQCGGLTVNEKGQTNIKGLYAIGECANTGLHGANRLASNSLLEGLVFGREVAEWVAGIVDEMPFEKVQPIDYRLSLTYDEEYLRGICEIKASMSKYATISSGNSQLKKAQKKIKAITERLTPYFKQNIVSENALIAQNILIMAQQIVSAKWNESDLSTSPINLMDEEFF